MRSSALPGASFEVYDYEYGQLQRWHHDLADDGWRHEDCHGELIDVGLREEEVDDSEKAKLWDGIGKFTAWGEDRERAVLGRSNRKWRGWQV